ncbi:hypothetical protein CRENBAI_024826 [Crenichthys baileyi]|uniref:Uncharacterized protein n=1 Tax=Crenichthys baileyi TaxID=28760 RepID=A0AAV9S953_9TELE
MSGQRGTCERDAKVVVGNDTHCVLRNKSSVRAEMVKAGMEVWERAKHGEVGSKWGAKRCKKNTSIRSGMLAPFLERKRGEGPADTRATGDLVALHMGSVMHEWAVRHGEKSGQDSLRECENWAKTREGRWWKGPRSAGLAVLDNLLTSMKFVLHGMGVLRINLANSRNKVHAHSVLSCGRCFDEEQVLLPFLSHALSSLWADQGVKAAAARGYEYELNDSALYFFENMSRITSPDYVPTETDVLRVRLRTTGVIETQFKVNHLIFSTLISVHSQAISLRSVARSYQGSSRGQGSELGSRSSVINELLPLPPSGTSSRMRGSDEPKFSV